MAKILVIDISGWQVDSDLALTAKAGYRGVICKATQGTGYINPLFAKQWADTVANGMVPGSYHFNEWLRDATPQIEHYVKTVLAKGGHFGAGTIPPALDTEAYKPDKGTPILPHTYKPGSKPAVLMRGTYDGDTYAVPPSPANTALERSTFVTTQHLDGLTDIMGRTGRKPISYIGNQFWSDRMVRAKANAQAIASHGLWLARPGVLKPPQMQDFPHWPATLWQYSHTGRVPGIKGNCDINEFRGSGVTGEDLEGEWRVFCGLEG